MAYVIKYHRDSTFNTFNTEVFDWKEDMVAAGWRVLGSGDGLSKYENSGFTFGNGLGSGGAYDVWETDADAANGSGGNGSWLRLGTPLDAPAAMEYLFEMENTTNPGNNEGTWRILISRNGTGFVTGGTFGVPPTAADGVAVGFRDPATNGNNTSSWHPAGAGKTFWWIGDVDENYDWMFMVLLDSETVFSVVGQLYVDQLSPIYPADPDPYIHIRMVPTSSGSSSNMWGFSVHNIFDPDGSNATESEEVDVARTTNPVGAFMSYRLDAGHPMSGTWEGGLSCPAFKTSATLDPVMNTPVDPATGKDHIFSPLLWGKPEGRATFMKGWTSGNTLQLSPTLPRDGNWKIVKVSATEWRWVMDGLSLPWPVDVDFEEF